MRFWRVVFLDQSTLPIALPRLSFPHELKVYETTRAEQVVERIADADIVLSNKVRLSDTALAAAANLRMIGVPAVGLDHLDRDYCVAHDIAIFNAAGYASEGVGEHALMLMLVLRRRLADYQAAARDGRWSDARLFCYLGVGFDDLGGQTLGLIGRGGIGTALERMAEGLGMRVLRAERRGASDVRSGYTAFEEVLRRSDVVSLHVPLTAETAKIINAETLAMMRPSAILINTGRGGLIDELALLEALHSGTIAAAGLDVLEVEPPLNGHPLLHGYVGDNLLITPHSAWLGRRTLQRLVDILHEKIERAVAAYS